MEKISKQKKPFRTEEREYIAKHHQSKTVQQICNHVKRSSNSIYGYMIANNIPIYVKPEDEWRRKNSPIDRKPVPEGCFNV
ncbi:MAG: hypothetical protein WKF70_14475, partial [Chitinophagaceae bacterium]